MVAQPFFLQSRSLRPRAAALQPGRARSEDLGVEPVSCLRTASNVYSPVNQLSL
jgi:hypothetical protein